MGKGRLASSARTQKERRDILISLAEDNAERMLRDGTAPPSIIAALLREGSHKQELEEDLLGNQVELSAAKTEQIRSNHSLDELFTNAMQKWGIYAGRSTDEPDEEEDDGC